MWEMHDGWGWWMLFGWAWFVLFWGGIVWLVAWSVSKVQGKSQNGGSGGALDIAKQRLARGEISEEEYLRLKQHLT